MTRNLVDRFDYSAKYYSLDDLLPVPGDDKDTWITKDFRRLKPSEMTDTHVFHTRNLLQRCLDKGKFASKKYRHSSRTAAKRWLRIMERELRRRG